jgi:hypothetical protein
MYKIIITMVLIFIVACTENGAENKKDPATAAGVPPAESVFNAPENRAKIKLDDATRANTWQIKAMMHDSWKSKDLDKVATDLQSKTNELLRECRMSGQDHEALHKWLEQFLVDLRQLKDPSANRVQAYISMQRKLEEFDRRFE